MSTQLRSDFTADLFPMPLDQRAGRDVAAPLPTFDLASSEPLAPVSPSVWLDGDVLMCACPDCHAPMAIRLWLMTADCWKCGTSIELSEEQEREALRLLRTRERALAGDASAAVPRGTAAFAPAAPGVLPSRTPAPAAAPPPEKRNDAAVPRAPASPSRPPLPRRQPAAAAEKPSGRRTRRRPSGLWLNRLLRMMPAWLVSLLFHLVLLTVLALLNISLHVHEPDIVLNTVASIDPRRPGQANAPIPGEVVHFDLPVPDKIDLQDRRTRETMVRADQDARELRLLDTADSFLPDVETVKRQIGNPDGVPAALAARDPRVRIEMLKQEGGTVLTEAAVSRGLRWLARQQQPDGRWRLDGGMDSDAAGTALALLPYLGAGQTHLTGRYKETVSKGLRWLVDRQKPDGDLRADGATNAGMYAHGQGAIVLSEAYLMTGDEALRGPAQKAIDFIVAGQYPDGGWRYQPAKELSRGQQQSDTSVVGWQLMALQSARAAKLHVPDETFELAGHYLDSASHRDGALYSYQPRHQATHVMTAEALLCRVYLGWGDDHPALRAGVRFLLDKHPPREGQPNIYYWYYATQALHHLGGSDWDEWNQRMRDVLVSTQEKRGDTAGSWDPRGEHASAGGRLYMTALAVCSLEVYYRHLPIFRRIKMD